MQTVSGLPTFRPKLSVRVRRATSNDRPAVLALLAEYLPGADVGARYDWLYRANPHGRAISVIAFDGTSGAPIGITSIFPRRVHVAGVARLGSMGGDGFVRPAFRRRGVATRLHKASMA